MTISNEELDRLRCRGVRRIAFVNGLVAEVEFFPPREEVQPKEENEPREGFRRRQREMADKRTAKDLERERRQREHERLFASTPMVPHLSATEE